MTGVRNFTSDRYLEEGEQVVLDPSSCLDDAPEAGPGPAAEPTAPNAGATPETD